MKKGKAMDAIRQLACRLEPPFRARYLGFGLIFAWSSIAFETRFAASPWNSPVFGESIIYLASTLVAPIVCVLAMLLCRKKPITHWGFLFVAAPLMCAIASLCLSFDGAFSGFLGVLMTVLGTLFAGAAPVILVLLWMEAIGATGFEEMEVVIPSSFIMPALASAIVPFLSWEGAVVFECALPLISGACLILAWFGKDGAEEKSLHAADASDSVYRGKGSLSSANVVAAAIAICIAYLSTMAISTVVRDAGPWLTFVQAIGYLFAVALAFFLITYSVRIDLDALYRVIVVPAIVALALCAYAPVQAIGICIASAVVPGLSIIVLLYFTRWSCAHNYPISYGESIGQLAAYSGIFLGTIAKIALQGPLSHYQVSPEGIALMSVSLFACSTLLVFRSGSTFELSASDDVAAVEESACASAGSLDETSACGSLANASCELVLADESESAFSWACSAVAKDSGLSPRETEIFVMLAQGRSLPYIRDALVLSKNTVSTHARHIYSKLEVHSKQELLDLVEAKVAER